MNKKSIEEIESALFVLALDEKNPEMPAYMNKGTVAALQMLHGLGSLSNCLFKIEEKILCIHFSLRFKFNW